MTFSVIYHDGSTTVVEWFPSILDRIGFGKRYHVAVYGMEPGGPKLLATNRFVKEPIVPNQEFFDAIYLESI